MISTAGFIRLGLPCAILGSLPGRKSTSALQELWFCAAPVRRRNGNVRGSSVKDSWLAAEHVNRQGAVRRLVGRTVPGVAASPL